MTKKNKEPLLYYRTMDQIKAYQKVPVEWKLRWLEEGARFLHDFMPKKYQKVRQAFRQGKTS
jgi:hypothetical protein